jgi:hypothetical protein
MAFSTATPRATSAPARFGLTVDQLHLLHSRCAGLTLPAEFQSDWVAEITADERDERTRAAELGLIDQGLLRAVLAGEETEADFADRVHPAVLGFLRLFTEPAMYLSVRSWGSGRTIVQTVAVRAGFAAALVRGQRLDDHGANPVNEDAVELSAFPVTALISEALRPLLRLEPSRSAAARPTAPASGAVVLPLTLAQGMIGAIRTGNPEIIHGAALEVGLPHAPHVLQAAAFGIDAGYSLAATTLTGNALAVHWFRGNAGWFEMSADTPLLDSGVSAIDIADASRVRVATTNTAAITAQVTVAVGSLLGVLRG